MYNKVFLIGNLTRDPELRYTPSGIPVVRFTVAVNRLRGKNAKEGDEQNAVDFIPVVAWRRLAEICGEYLKKGRSVSIEGRLQVRTFEKAGEKRTVYEILADGMQMLGRRPEGPSVTPEPSAISEEKEAAPLDEAGAAETEKGVDEVPF